ncbi:MAG: succinoglycan biosynthesis transport protein ExoP, partial [Myxococcota bacterium]
AGAYRYRSYLKTQLDIINSQDIAADVLDSLALWDDERLFPKSDTDEEVSVEDLRLIRAASFSELIHAKHVPDSLIVEVAFEHSDAELAAEIANATVETYVVFNLKQRQATLDQAGKELTSLLEVRRLEKDRVANAARDFERQHNIVAIDTRHKELQSERAYFNTRALEAERALIAARAVLHEVKREHGSGVYGTGPRQALNSAVLNQLKQHYGLLKSKVAEFELVYGPKHNKLVGARRQLKQVRSAINKEVGALRRAAQATFNEALAEKTVLAERFEEARTEDEALSVTVVTHENLEKEVTRQTEMFDRLRKRYEETVISQTLAEASNNVRPLNRALVPTAAVWPRRTLTMAFASVVGLMVSLLFILLLNRGDTRIRTKTQLEAVIPAPCLGVLPRLPAPSGRLDVAAIQRRDLFTHENPMSHQAEMARSVRTNLLFLSAERQLRSILITSALPQEGKTTVSIQIATTLAATGSKVLLIEADMRRPRIAPTLSLPSDVGLSQYLADRTRTEASIIVKSQVPGLDVIVCGPIPPNPAELLNSLRLNQLITRLRESYDIIVFDSPPTNAVSDAVVMASRVDGVLFVANSQKSRREPVRAAYNSLAAVDAPMVGTILNGVRPGGGSYYYRGGYYYRSAYPSLESAELPEAEDKRRA